MWQRGSSVKRFSLRRGGYRGRRQKKRQIVAGHYCSIGNNVRRALLCAVPAPTQVWRSTCRKWLAGDWGAKRPHHFKRWYAGPLPHCAPVLARYRAESSWHSARSGRSGSHRARTPATGSGQRRSGSQHWPPAWYSHRCCFRWRLAVLRGGVLHVNPGLPAVQLPDQATVQA